MKGEDRHQKMNQLRENATTECNEPGLFLFKIVKNSFTKRARNICSLQQKPWGFRLYIWEPHYTFNSTPSTRYRMALTVSAYAYLEGRLETLVPMFFIAERQQTLEKHIGQFHGQTAGVGSRQGKERSEGSQSTPMSLVIRSCRCVQPAHLPNRV